MTQKHKKLRKLQAKQKRKERKMYTYDVETRTLTVTQYNDLWFYHASPEEKPNFIQKIVINDTEPIETSRLCQLLSEAEYQTVEDIEICADNPQYESIDGIVYTKPLRWAKFCPKGKMGSVHIAEGTGKIRIGAFRRCKISNVYMPDSVKTIEEGAFTFCSLLKEVCGGKNVETIGRLAFYRCKSLESFCFGNALQEIADQAFEGTQLKQVSFGNKLERIGNEAFYDCDIKNVTLPESIMEIGVHALLRVTEVHMKTYHNTILTACTDSSSVDSDPTAKFTVLYLENHPPIVIPKYVLNIDKESLDADIKQIIETGESKNLRKYAGNMDNVVAVAIKSYQLCRTEASCQEVEKLANYAAERAIAYDDVLHESFFVRMIQMDIWPKTALEKMLKVAIKYQRTEEVACILEKMKQMDNQDFAL